MELFIGRLHPLIVHFPIGILVVSMVMELFTIGGKRPGLRQGIYWMVLTGAGTAILAALLGWLLSNADDYSGDLVQSHQNWGIATATLSSLCATLLYFTENQRITNLVMYRSTLFLSVVLLTIASHLGASLTHGEDYLSSAWESPQENEDHQGSQEFLAELNQLDTYSETQLEQLNLEVRAIFARNCYQCHSENKKKGDLVLEHKRGVYQGGESGEIIVAGDAESSELYRRVSLPTNHKEVMPKKGKSLKDHQIALIKLWIDQGAYWADRALDVFPEAPLALNKPTLPESDKFDYAIDRLVNQYFEQNNLSWPELVDDRIFVRRAYLDIVGLLPTQEQSSDFISNRSPNKREQLVDQLLADHHNYTQHWLSFWNDLLRNDYSGTGFITGGRKQITEWLYYSLYHNKPYNMMVKQLINPSDESEGFIKGIKWRGVVNASQSTEMQAAQNISQSLMGMNLKCASCHNSFVSNLTLEQAYNFAAIFADSALELNRCDQPLGKFAQPQFLYTELGVVEADSIKERLAQLSEIMVKPENGRLYRTIANRIWKKLLGRGIIEPVDLMDNTPWDPLLLDWLAADFIDSGYDLKHLIRSIMTSHVYQLPTVGYRETTEVTAENYRFEGPTIRRLTAEQFTDAVSQIVAPVYVATAYDPIDSEFPIGRIWHREIKFDRDVLPEPGDRYFRYQFELPDQEIKEAWLLVSVDHSYQLYLNGTLLSEGQDWRQVDKLKVEQHLSAGNNLLALKGTNEGSIANPAGILLGMRMVTSQNDTLFVYSDKNWKSTSETPQDNWQLLEYDDSQWSQVRNYGSKHWDRLVNMSFDEDVQTYARASLVRQHPFMKALGRPTRENVATTRSEQATLLQALELTNGAYFTEILKKGASRWLSECQHDPSVISDLLYQRAFGRDPSKKEKTVIAEAMGESPASEDVEDLLWATLLSPEFQFIY